MAVQPADQLRQNASVSLSAALGSMGAGALTVGAAEGEHERNGLAFADGKIAYCLEVLPAQIDGRAQQRHIGAGDSLHRAVRGARHPRHRRAIVEAQHEFAAHGELPAPPGHDAHEMVRPLPHRHEVDQRGRAIRGFEIGLQDERIVAVAAGDARIWIGGSDPPAAVLRRAEQGCETGRRVETGPAQPVNGAVAANQSRRLAIANDGIVFDTQRHFSARCC